jgi:protoporphyrinogen oxidase
MRPYNEKVWAQPLEAMGVDWQGERVPDVDIARIDANHAADRDDAGWGPNATFSFPALGTGLLFERIADGLPKPVHLGTAAHRVDPVRRTVTFSDGSTTRYDQLVSTVPLTALVASIEDAPPTVREAAAALVRTSGIFVGIGVRGEVPPERCWVYYPDADVPFYRVTYLSNYARRMAPEPGLFSLLAEISVSDHRPFPMEDAIDRTIEAMTRVGLLTDAQARADIVSRHLMTVTHSYPVPTLDRDDALTTIQSWLGERGILSRGRFGAWRYEIGNTDHSLMMGAEAADRALDDRPEAETVWSGGR